MLGRGVGLRILTVKEEKGVIRVLGKPGSEAGELIISVPLVALDVAVLWRLCGGGQHRCTEDGRERRD